MNSKVDDVCTLSATRNVYFCPNLTESERVATEPGQYPTVALFFMSENRDQHSFKLNYWVCFTSLLLLWLQMVCLKNSSRNYRNCQCMFDVCWGFTKITVPKQWIGKRIRFYSFLHNNRSGHNFKIFIRTWFRPIGYTVGHRSGIHPPVWAN